jgi:hypothetical protein
MFRVIGGDGKEYGPVTLDQLKTWIAENRFNAQSRIRAEGSYEWKTASEIPEVAAILGVPVSEPAAPPLAPADLSSRSQSSQGLAITSLVLGIVSVVAVFCGGLLAGIAAIICGHIAFNRVKRNPAQYSGSGMAMAGFILGYVSLALSLLVLPAMFLPALSGAKKKAQRINCVNNLKQVGLAFKVWELDHGDQFPFNVSTNGGGTAELAQADREGYDRNAALHFQVMSNELSTPVILVCPEDSKAVRAQSFAGLTGANVSYRLRSGTNVSDVHPQEILAECPIHHHILYCDGSVQTGERLGKK